MKESCFILHSDLTAVHLMKEIFSTWSRGRDLSSHHCDVSCLPLDWTSLPLGSFWAPRSALHVLTVPRLQEPRQPPSQNRLCFLLTNKWLSITIVFLTGTDQLLTIMQQGTWNGSAGPRNPTVPAGGWKTRTLNPYILPKKMQRKWQAPSDEKLTNRIKTDSSHTVKGQRRKERDQYDPKQPF